MKNHKEYVLFFSVLISSMSRKWTCNSSIYAFLYCGQIFQPWVQKRRLEYVRLKLVVSGILHHFESKLVTKLTQEDGTPDVPAITKLVSSDSNLNLSSYLHIKDNLPYTSTASDVDAAELYGFTFLFCVLVKKQLDSGGSLS